MDEAMKLKNRMVSVFKRNGREGKYVRLFDHLEQWQKDFLANEMPLQENEVPVIGGVEGPDKWFLITTQRIVWRLKVATQFLPIDRVSEAFMDFSSLSSARAKSEMQELQITTRDSQRYTFPIEEGAPLMGVWNVLKGIGFRNRKAPDTPSL